MMILAIESSALVASVAVLEDDVLKAEFTVNNKLTHSETLLPMLKQMMEIAGLDPDKVDAIAVAAGPGSFTGLRIGAATAKGLALAWNRPIVRVSTLQAMAFGLSTMSDALICPIMDARRGQVYSAVYQGGAVLLPEAARSIDELLQDLDGLEISKETAEYIFLGDGVPPCGETIASRLEGDVCFAGPEFSRQRAAGVAVLGSILFNRWLDRTGLTPEELRTRGADGIDCFGGDVMHSDDFAPDYLRQSQAERELAEGVLEDAGQHSLHKLEKGLEKAVRRQR